MERIFHYIRMAIKKGWQQTVSPALAEILIYLFRSKSVHEDIRAVGQSVVAGAIISLMSTSGVGLWANLAMLIVGLFMVVRGNRGMRAPKKEE